ncbi:MAG TPA: hypothetical protein VFI08_12640 [Spirochaetia bacterium]|nr:hypothetical protein [Spirochaetia bacterium]
MALLPIDLQTLFSQTAQVGKEQAVQKDAPPAAQSLQGAQLVQKAETRDNSVNEARNQEEGPEQVKDKARRGAERRERRQKKGAAAAAPARAPRNVVKDPDLGRNVDITG